MLLYVQAPSHRKTGSLPESGFKPLTLASSSSVDSDVSSIPSIVTDQSVTSSSSPADASMSNRVSRSNQYAVTVTVYSCLLVLLY